MSRPHGWMWEQGGRPDLDAAEWEDWTARAREIKDLASWFRGATHTRFPTKAELHDGGPDLVLKGWLPPEPLIRPGTRVMALGSCFAAHFIEWLAENGFEQQGNSPLLVLARNPFENVAVIAQQFRWAFGEVDPNALLWIDKSKQRIYATEEKRLAMRQSLMEADVFIATIALSEVWYDKPTGEPLWRIMPQQLHDPERHAFKVLSFAENVAALEAIERIRARWLPKLKIIYTISPLPLFSTFRPVSPVTANTASKAIVRGALDEFLRGRGDDFNRIYFYFPSYELVHSLLGSPFLADNRHLFDEVVSFVLDMFARNYTEIGEIRSASAQVPTWPQVPEERELLRAAERRNVELQRVCDERLQVIEDLKRTCDERLALIEQLHKSLNGS